MLDSLKIDANGETALEKQSRIAREDMLNKNITIASYSIGSPTMEDNKDKIYSPTHTNAKSDFTINQPTDSLSEVDKGKGTPNEIFDMNTPNSLKTEKGGSRTDVFGIKGLPTGRVELTKKNNYWGGEYYNGRKPYRYDVEIKVDTKKNKSQFRLK